MQIVYPIYYLFRESDIACAPHCSAHRLQFNEHKWKKPHDKCCRTWVQSAGANVIVNHLINDCVGGRRSNGRAVHIRYYAAAACTNVETGSFIFAALLVSVQPPFWWPVSVFDHHLCRIFSRLNAYHKSPRNYFHPNGAHAHSTRIDNINRAHSILL